MSEEDQALEQALARVAGAQGRVSALRLRDGAASLILDVTGLDAGRRNALEAEVRAVLLAVPGVAEARIAMTAEKVQRVIVAIGSGKGGVRKSTVGANLAVALARAGRRVGLVDADIYGPSQPRIMGNNQRPEL